MAVVVAQFLESSFTAPEDQGSNPRQRLFSSIIYLPLTETMIFKKRPI